MKIHFRIILRPFLLLFLFLSLTLVCWAQEKGDSTKSTLESFDSTVQISDSLTVSTERVEAKDSNTLFFVAKNNAADLYDSSHFQLRPVPDSVALKLKSDDAFWYANKELSKPEEPVNKRSNWARFWENFASMLETKLFQRIVWVLILVLFGAIVIWFLIQNNIQLFNSRMNPTIGDNHSKDEELPEDFPAAIENAVRAGNFRLAIRLQYLRLLQNMTARKIIEYRQDKTNMDYLLQLYGSTYYNDFFRLTRNYEYAWYGNFDVNENKYNLVKNDFDQLNVKLQAKA